MIQSGLSNLKNSIIDKFTCAICKMPLLGVFHEDAWGNRFCVKHTNEFHRCSCCQRLICEPLTGGGVAYQDKRLVCNICRQTAIDTKEQAKPYIEANAAWLYQMGFTFQALALKIDLVYRDDLIHKSEHKGGGEPMGMIYTSVNGGRRKPFERRVEGVAILKGLSRHVMEGVAIHELGHAWLFLHGVDSLDGPTEEGFCNMLSYLYHDTFDTDEARFCKLVIEKSPDPVYGDGFRAVHQAVNTYGLSQIVDYLRLYRMLPPV